MDYFALLLPVLLIVGLLVALVFLRRYLFGEENTPDPLPIPRQAGGMESAPENPMEDMRAAPPRIAPGLDDSLPGKEVSLTPARPYPRPPLNASQMSVFARLLKALPGYVVLPKITYDHFLEARDGSVSENTSLQNRAAQHIADFLICDRKLRVLLVCQIEDGSQLPARVQERQKMLEKAGLRLLRWNTGSPPDPAKLLTTVQTLERMVSNQTHAES